MTRTLREIFPNLHDLLALEPEDVGGVILEIAPSIMQSGGFNLGSLRGQLFPSGQQPAYPPDFQQTLMNAILEAVSRMESLGLLYKDPEQISAWYRLTRRAQSLATRTDVEQFLQSRILPLDLLQPSLSQKVWPLFLRGDYDIAVFQAFRVVEIAVRNAAKSKGKEFRKDLVGKDLMNQAFNIETGPLRDTKEDATKAEQEAEKSLFAGAMGHARNPSGHRDTNMSPQEAARLIVFASHLLGIVEHRQ